MEMAFIVRLFKKKYIPYYQRKTSSEQVMFVYLYLKYYRTESKTFQYKPKNWRIQTSVKFLKKNDGYTFLEQIYQAHHEKVNFEK